METIAKYVMFTSVLEAMFSIKLATTSIPSSSIGASVLLIIVVVMVTIIMSGNAGFLRPGLGGI